MHTNVQQIIKTIHFKLQHVHVQRLQINLKEQYISYRIERETSKHKGCQ